MQRSRGALVAEFAGLLTAPGWISAALAGMFAALLVFAPPVYASGQREESLADHHGMDAPDPHAGITEFAALRDYARRIGLESPRPVANNVSPHSHFDDADLTALREYAGEVGIAQPSTAAQND